MPLHKHVEETLSRSFLSKHLKLPFFRCLASTIALHGSSMGIRSTTSDGSSSAASLATRIMQEGSFLTHSRAVQGSMSQDPLMIPYITGCLPPQLQQLALGISYTNSMGNNSKTKETSATKFAVENQRHGPCTLPISSGFSCVSKEETRTWNPPPVFRSAEFATGAIMPSISLNTTAMALASLAQLKN